MFAVQQAFYSFFGDYIFPVTQFKGHLFTQNTGVSRLCWKCLAFPPGIGDDSSFIC